MFDQNVYKHNFPSQLSEVNGFKVNEMADGSRIVVLRPCFSESRAFFARKFDVQSARLEQLIRGNDYGKTAEKQAMSAGAVSHTANTRRYALYTFTQWKI